MDEGSYGYWYQLFRGSKEGISGIKKVDVTKFLLDQLIYTLHKPSSKGFKRNMFIVKVIDVQWQADLAYIQGLAQ